MASASGGLVRKARLPSPETVEDLRRRGERDPGDGGAASAIEHHQVLRGAMGDEDAPPVGVEADPGGRLAATGKRRADPVPLEDGDEVLLDAGHPDLGAVGRHVHAHLTRLDGGVREDLAGSRDR
jgi:hypothetical protein